MAEVLRKSVVPIESRSQAVIGTVELRRERETELGNPDPLVDVFFVKNAIAATDNGVFRRRKSKAEARRKILVMDVEEPLETLPPGTTAAKHNRSRQISRPRVRHCGIDVGNSARRIRSRHLNLVTHSHVQRQPRRHLVSVIHEYTKVLVAAAGKRVAEVRSPAVHRA